ncbi:hypothetical protein IAD21_01322 [Abditibacteriota bacterium]|nr:hypothetical protein IAD21_01322 [Abditibacteriota bacterium]
MQADKCGTELGTTGDTVSVPLPFSSLMQEIFAYNPIPTSYREAVDLMRVRQASVRTIDEPGEWEIALLHGWHSLYAPMMRLEENLRERFPNARLWRVSYDSHWKVFPRSAREASARLRAAGAKPQRTILVGYSMGGVVARSMVAQGFDAHAVVCLCSPHLGPALHIPFGDVGSLSLAYSAPYLRRLNSDPHDIARREDYFFQSITFRDSTGESRHDRIVSYRSASGRGLEGIVHRANTHIVFEGVAPGPLPHLQGMTPEKVPQALDFIEERMR